MLDAQQNLFGKRVQPVEKWLKRYLKSGFVLRYERRKEIASDETVGSHTVQPFVLTPTLVSQQYEYHLSARLIYICSCIIVEASFTLIFVAS